MEVKHPQWNGTHWVLEGTAYLHILIQTEEEAAEMAKILNRGLNTLNPMNWPKWASDLVARLEK